VSAPEIPERAVRVSADFPDRRRVACALDHLQARADDPGTVERLIRDDIPKIATDAGQQLCLRTAEPHEMRGLLIRKLTEETREVADAMTDAETLDELADLTEVRDALLAELGYTVADLEQARADKLKERGGFTRRIVLVTR
jgi:predicted house-cleaning noncanonical NTP pyrophosphatase (MazG superfamily)